MGQRYRFCLLVHACIRVCVEGGLGGLGWMGGWVGEAAAKHVNFCLLIVQWIPVMLYANCASITP